MFKPFIAFTFTLFLLSSELAVAGLVRPIDGNTLRKELTKTDGVIRIVLVTALDENGDPFDSASETAIMRLEKAIVDHKKNNKKAKKKDRKKDLKGYLVNISDQTGVKEALSYVPRFAKNKFSYPYYAFVKNGGVQSKLQGFLHKSADILDVVKVVETYEDVPKRWTLEHSQISLQYIYVQDNCTQQQLESEVALLKEAAKSLGISYNVVADDEEHSLYSAAGIEVYFAASHNGIFLEKDCRRMTAIIEWLGSPAGTGFVFQTKSGSDVFDKDTLFKQIEALRVGDY